MLSINSNFKIIMGQINLPFESDLLSFIFQWKKSDFMTFFKLSVAELSEELKLAVVNCLIALIQSADEQ